MSDEERKEEEEEEEEEESDDVTTRERLGHRWREKDDDAASRGDRRTRLERVEAVVQTLADGQRRDRGVEPRVYRPRRRRARDAASRSRELALMTTLSLSSRGTAPARGRHRASRARAPRQRRRARGRARGGRRRHVSARDATPREESTARREVPTRLRRVRVRHLGRRDKRFSPIARFQHLIASPVNYCTRTVLTGELFLYGMALSSQVGFATRDDLTAHILISRNITSSPSPPPLTDARLTPSRRPRPPSP